MLDIYVCEDNKKTCEFISNFISDYCIFRNLDAGIVLATPYPDEILDKYIASETPALFFLDIDLKTKINGIELASHIRKQGRKAFIVFVTTHSEMTLLTFQYKVEALDFIIKDNQSDMKKKIGDCISTAVNRLNENPNSRAIKVNVDDKIIFVDMDEIIFIESTHIRHKLRLHAKKRTLEFNGELKIMQQQLDDKFIRCHKSYIVNKDKISSINKRENTITLINKIDCPISRSGKKLLLQL
ncbi:MAG: LytTR family DNA-binding domain-containing protein [Oscillospiraceae bacterium]|nr:LytTR family DNA-binding domain-containing protein [Oscillospiraceae bacterium]